MNRYMIVKGTDHPIEALNGKYILYSDYLKAIPRECHTLRYSASGYLLGCATSIVVYLLFGHLT